MITYVLDTSILVCDPGAWQHFIESQVIIPIASLNELDDLKKVPGDVGRNARICIRMLDEISDRGDITVGVLLDDDILLKIDVNSNIIPDASFGSPTYGDTQILACAYYYHIEFPNDNVVLVSNDISLKIKAKARGIEAISYEGEKFSITELYAGLKTVENVNAANELNTLGKIFSDNYGIDLNYNECVYFEKENILGRKVSDRIVEIIKKSSLWGIYPKNKEQACAMDLILDKAVDLVTLTGAAGSGKTLCAIASSLELIIGKRDYSKLVIYRPIQAVGSDIGYVPGTVQEKLEPWFSAVMDAFEFLLSKNKEWKKDLEMWQKKGLIEFGAMTYIRGRSLSNAIIMVEECFPYEQTIAIEGGKTKKIGTLHDLFVSGKYVPKVKTYNEKDDIFEYKNIIGTKKYEKRQLFEITCSNRTIKCTDNHKFLTTKGWLEAKQLKTGSIIKMSEPTDQQILKSLNEDQKQVLLGSFLGDGSISNHGNSRYRLKILHGKEQKEYCKWKAKIFDSDIKFIEKNGYSQLNAYKFCSKMFISENLFPKNKNTIPQWILDNLDERGLAIWFMDDGSVNKDYYGARISSCSFDDESNERAVLKLKSMGINCNFQKWYSKRYKKYFGYIVIPNDAYYILCDLVAPYIHANMQYKFNVKIGGYEWDNKFKTHGLTVVDNLKYLNEYQEVYDIEVEDNHNFIVCSKSKKTNSGLIAHNCQNISKDEIKTILTRAGAGTKVILNGDLDQIDRNDLDATNNGLVYVIEKFKNDEGSGHITFTQGERSRLATKAAEIL